MLAACIVAGSSRHFYVRLCSAAVRNKSDRLLKFAMRTQCHRSSNGKSMSGWHASRVMHMSDCAYFHGVHPR
jgi:hypothetical protein